MNYETYSKTLLASLDFRMLFVLANESAVTECLFRNFRDLISGQLVQFHLLLVTHTHTTNAVMPFFDRVSVHSALQVLLNVVLQLFALLLACLTSYVPSIAFAISASVAVSPRVTNRERLNGFLLNLILRTLVKFVGIFQS